MSKFVFRLRNIKCYHYFMDLTQHSEYAQFVVRLKLVVFLNHVSPT